MHGRDDLVARAHEARPAREVVQDAELGQREVGLLRLDDHLVAVDVDHEPSAEEDEALRARRHLLHGAVPPEHIPQPRHQDARAERLRDIVLRAELDACDDIGLLALRGDHHDRDRSRLLVLLHPPAHLESVEVGQHEVEDDEVRLLAAQHLEREAAAVDRPRAHARALGVELDELRDLRLVLDDQQLRLGGGHAS